VALCLLALAAIVAPAAWLLDALILRPITLVKDALYGWEGHDLNLAFEARPRLGRVTRYELDVDNDGKFDYTADAHPTKNAAVEFNLPLLGLLGNPADDGDYPATLRLHTSWGARADFPVEISVGNLPAAVNFGDDTDGEPGEPFVLEVSVDDPGPDTIQRLEIDWGDGQTEVIAGTSWKPSHVYATDGKYLIRATVIDEDGSNWAEQYVNIGNTDAPLVPSKDPRIVSAVSKILKSGNALLTIKAVDCDGGTDLAYQWDLEGKGEFVPGTNVAEIAPRPHFYRYSATVRITDAQGRWTEGLFGFPNPNSETHSSENTESPK
jgi:hypothetical protein